MESRNTKNKIGAVYEYSSRNKEVLGSDWERLACFEINWYKSSKVDVKK